MLCDVRVDVCAHTVSKSQSCRIRKSTMYHPCTALPVTLPCEVLSNSYERKEAESQLRLITKRDPGSRASRNRSQGANKAQRQAEQLRNAEEDPENGCPQQHGWIQPFKLHRQQQREIKPQLEPQPGLRSKRPPAVGDKERRSSCLWARFLGRCPCILTVAIC